MSLYRMEFQPGRSFYPTLGLGLRRIGSGSLWDSGRRMFASPPQASVRAWIGQTPASTNRLLDIPVKTIVSRWILAMKPAGMSLDAFKTQITYSGEGLAPMYITGVWTDQNVAQLAAIEAAPTPEEIADLSMIDGFFLPPTSDNIIKDAASWQYGTHGTGMIKDLFCPPPGSSPDDRRLMELRNALYNFFDPNHPCKKPGYGGRDCATGSPIPGSESNPFYCPPVTVQYPRDNIIGPFDGAAQDSQFMTIVKMGYFSGLAPDLKINPDETWGAVKPVVKNALAFMDGIKDYPFPSPLSLRPSYWYVTAANDVIGLVHGNLPLDREFVHFWVTLSVLNHYDEASARLMSELKKEAREDKVDAMIQKIAIAVVLTAISAGLAAAAVPALIAAAATSSLNAGVSLLDIKERKDAAKSLMDAEKLFAKTDPEYAKELQKASDTLDAQAAQAAAALPPPPGTEQFQQDQAKIAADLGIKAPTSTGTYIAAGGIAAGVIAAVVALVR